MVLAVVLPLWYIWSSPIPSTVESAHSENRQASEVLSVFIYQPDSNMQKLHFPDRTKQAAEAKAYDAQREQARLEAVRQAELAKQAQAQVVVQSPAIIASVSADLFITALGQCESGNTANKNSGNGYYGAFQFSANTWNAMGTGYARADLAPYEIQVAAVKKLLSGSSVRSQFPGCSRKLGL